MDGPAHYREAERCLAFAATIETDGDQDSMSAWYQRQAQVFATLALTAAVVAGSPMSPQDRKAWAEASDGGLHTPLLPHQG
jgi:GMP synthase-like glutamine amidotransferase